VWKAHTLIFSNTDTYSDPGKVHIVRSRVRERTPGA